MLKPSVFFLKSADKAAVIWRGTLHLLPIINIQLNRQQDTDGLMVLCKIKKKKAQLGSPLSCQSCGGKTTIQFNTFSQVPQRNINKRKPHIYTDCTRFRRCIENKNMLVKQTDIVAKCIAIIWWLQHQQQQTNSESIIKPAPPVPSALILFHTVLSRWRPGSITCPRTLDWRQLLRHFCRSDSHPEKQKRTSVSTTGVILNRAIGITNHSAC